MILRCHGHLNYRELTNMAIPKHSYWPLLFFSISTIRLNTTKNLFQHFYPITLLQQMTNSSSIFNHFAFIPLIIKPHPIDQLVELVIIHLKQLVINRHLHYSLYLPYLTPHYQIIDDLITSVRLKSIILHFQLIIYCC